MADGVTDEELSFWSRCSTGPDPADFDTAIVARLCGALTAARELAVALESSNARAASLIEAMSADRERLNETITEAVLLLADATPGPEGFRVATWQEAGESALRVLREATAEPTG